MPEILMVLPAVQYQFNVQSLITRLHTFSQWAAQSCQGLHLIIVAYLLLRDLRTHKNISMAKSLVSISASAHSGLLAAKRLVEPSGYLNGGSSLFCYP